MLLRGLLLLFIVLPVANLTFRIFAIEEFTHGYRLKNIVRQVTISFATASVIIVEQHRQALHQSAPRRVRKSVQSCVPEHARRADEWFCRSRPHAAEAHSLAIVDDQPDGRAAGELSGVAGRLLLPDRRGARAAAFSPRGKNRSTERCPILSKLTQWFGARRRERALRNYAIDDAALASTLDGLPFLAPSRCRRISRACAN